MSSSDSKKSDDIVVFIIRRSSECGECGKELWKGNFLRVEGERALCMHCADLDHLIFLPRGDAALTRRANKYSTLRAVVVQFSRTRKRYERQGVLVEEAALDRAEEECLADEEQRKRARERSAIRREELDKEYISSFSQRIGEIYPGCPPEESQRIAEHACRKHSGRVGRTAEAKALETEAVELAVRAHVRHRYTDYDKLLAMGLFRDEARNRVAARVEEQLDKWRG